MTVTKTKRRKKSLLCCGGSVSAQSPVPQSPRPDSPDDDQIVSTPRPDSPDDYPIVSSPRPGSPIEFGFKPTKRPSLWRRFKTYISDRIPTRIRIRIRHPCGSWEGSHENVHDLDIGITALHLSFRKKSILPVPSLSIIDERYDEKSDFWSTSSRSQNKRDDSITCSSDITLETDNFSTTSPIPPERYSNVSIHPEKHSSSNVLREARSNTSDSTSRSSSNEAVPSHNELTNNSRKERGTRRQKPKIISVKSADASDSSGSQKSNDSSNGESERMKKLRKRVAAKNKIEVLPQKVEKSISPKKSKSNVSRKEKGVAITNDENTTAKNTGETKLQNEKKHNGKEKHTVNEEKSTNSNAWSEESDNEGSEKQEKREKSAARKKVAFSEKALTEALQGRDQTSTKTCTKQKELLIQRKYTQLYQRDLTN